MYKPTPTYNLALLLISRLEKIVEIHKMYSNFFSANKKIIAGSDKQLLLFLEKIGKKTANVEHLNEILDFLRKIAAKVKPISQEMSFNDLDNDERRNFDFYFDDKEFKFNELLINLRNIYKDIYVYSLLVFTFNIYFKQVEVMVVYAGRALDDYIFYAVDKYIDNINYYGSTEGDIEKAKFYEFYGRIYQITTKTGKASGRSS